MFVKTFEEFRNSSINVFIANPLAEAHLEDHGYFIDESICGENNDDEKLIRLLEKAGFSSPQDFLKLDEALSVKYKGHSSTSNGVEIKIDVNGHEYGYVQQKDGMDIGDVARKFEKILQFSAGKALTWLKKNATLVSGSKKQEELNKEESKKEESKD